MSIKRTLKKQVCRIELGHLKLQQKMIATAICYVAILSVHSVNGKTLEEALVNAYQTNPGLQAARAKLRATDEAVNQALSGWRPSVEFSGTTGMSRVETNFDLGDSSRKPRSGQLSVSQNLYAGGQTVAETEQKQYDVLWKRAVLAKVEQSVLLDTAIAYMNTCLLYTSPSPRDQRGSRMPSSA